MNKPVETITCDNGVTIKVYQDLDAQSPADWDNTDAFLWSDHNDLYVGPREKPAKPGARGRLLPLSSLASLPDDFNPESYTPPYAIFSVRVGYNGREVYLNSGADVSSCFDADGDNNVWNSKAFVFIKRDCFPADHDLLATAKSIVDTWNTYLSGDVYGFVVEDAEGEQLHSCWGFYGLADCIEEAKSAAESHMPVARGRALLKNAADDVQRRLAHPPNDYPGLTWAADSIGASLWAADTNGDVLAAVGRECPGYNKELHSASYPYIVAVTAAWRDRYWPGE